MTYTPHRIRQRVTAPKAQDGTATAPARQKATVTVTRVHKQLAALRLCLRNLGLEFVEEHRFHPNRMWRFDLAVPDLKLAIEYQGHGQTGKAKGGKQGKHIGGHASVTGLSGDCEKDLHALLHGWRVLKFTALHFCPKKRDKHKLTAPLDAIRMMASTILSSGTGVPSETPPVAGNSVPARQGTTHRKSSHSRGDLLPGSKAPGGEPPL